nr:hypothetical protein [Tanacetum cinerariifolium]
MEYHLDSTDSLGSLESSLDTGREYLKIRTTFSSGRQSRPNFCINRIDVDLRAIDVDILTLGQYLQVMSLENVEYTLNDDDDVDDDGEAVSANIGSEKLHNKSSKRTSRFMRSTTRF